MNILLVSNGFPPTAYGGVEVYTYDLARGLVERGHQVWVFCRESDSSKPDYQLLEDDLDSVHVVRVVNDYKQISVFRRTFLDERIEAIFEQLLNKISPDLVHFNHLIALSARLPLICAQRQLPRLVTLHDYWSICHRVNLINRDQQICPGPTLAGPEYLRDGTRKSYGRGVCDRCVFGPSSGLLNRFIIPMAKKFTTPSMRRWARQVLRKYNAQAGPGTCSRAGPGTSSRAGPGNFRDDTIHVTNQVNEFDERFLIFRESILSAQKLLVPSMYVRQQYSANAYPAERLDVIPLGIPDTLKNYALRPDLGSSGQQVIQKSSIDQADLDEAYAETSARILTVTGQSNAASKVRFAFIGSLISIKGVDVLIRAFSNVDGDHISLEIFGRDDIEPQSFITYIKKLADMDPRITFKGVFDPGQRADAYKDINALVIPSRAPETFSLVAREALSLGKPVIAPNLGALPEVVIDKVNGFLYDPDDDIGLERILREISRDPNILSQLECPGPALILSSSEHLDRIEQIYTQVKLNNRGATYSGM